MSPTYSASFIEIGLMVTPTRYRPRKCLLGVWTVSGCLWDRNSPKIKMGWINDHCIICFAARAKQWPKSRVYAITCPEQTLFIHSGFYYSLCQEKSRELMVEKPFTLHKVVSVTCFPYRTWKTQQQSVTGIISAPTMSCVTWGSLNIRVIEL